MNKYLLSLLCLISCGTALAQTGINTKTPQANLHVVASGDATKPDGIIFPRVTKANLISKTSIYSAAQTSAIVYVTDATATSTEAKFIKIDALGYYFFDGTNWQKIDSGMGKWDLKGNDIVDGMFLGTTNAKALQFKYNKVLAGFLNDLNTSYGYNALPFTATGTNNAAFGKNVLSVNSGGNNNAAIGNNALSQNTSGANNTAIGLNALMSNTDKNDNVAIGTFALQANTAANNVAIGSGAMRLNRVGNLNVAIGKNTLAAVTGTTASTAIGGNALQSSTGAGNTAIGSGTLDKNTTGSNNTAIGQGAATANTSGADNVGIGKSSLGGNVSGSKNIGIGGSSLPFNTISSDNIAIGNGTFTNLRNTATGSDYNVTLGAGSGVRLVTGRNNTFLGGRTGTVVDGATDLSYATAIGAQATVGASNTIVLGRSTNAGNTDKVGIGTAIPTHALHIKSVANPLKLEGVTEGAGYALLIGNDNVVYKSSSLSSFSAASTTARTANVEPIAVADLQKTIDAQNLLIDLLQQKLNELTKKIDALK